MLRTLSSDAFVSRCLRALGYTSNLPTASDYAQRVADCANDALRHVWTFAHWPMLRRTELRTYRPPFKRGLGFAKGQECWHRGAYWRAETDAPASEPSEGNPEWRRLAPDEVVRFIALDQPWENTEIALGGVNLRGFAYARDPKAFPDQPPIVGCSFAGDYPGGGTTRINLPRDAPDRVWVAFVPDSPRVSLTAWSSGAAYGYGDDVRHNGESWTCVASESSGEEPGVAASWRKSRIPEFLAPAAVAHFQSSMASEDQGRAHAAAVAQRLLEELHETYFGLQGVDDRADCDME